jgi:hypothetical protein
MMVFIYGKRGVNFIYISKYAKVNPARDINTSIYTCFIQLEGVWMKFL